MKNTVLGIVAAVLFVVAIVLFLRRCGGSEEQAEDPIKAWVCDSCGAEAKLPLENQSPDCSACDAGQMVQRERFRCKGCGEEFEAYQVNWSPHGERAAAKRKEADEHGPLPKGVRFSEGDVQLVRAPGGKWAWSESEAGKKIKREVSCPKCGGKDCEKLTER